MALDQEVAARRQDVTDAQQIVGGLATLAGGVPQALDLARQFAATLATTAPQFTALQGGVRDAASAQQAITAAQQIQARCQSALQLVNPAEQTWSSVGGLAQQRGAWLQARWQQTHQEPPSATAAAMADPLARALNAYGAATGQLDASMRAAVGFPPPPAPTLLTWPAAVAAWLATCAQQLTSTQAAITASADGIGATLPWAAVQAAADGAVTSAQDLLATAQRVAAALTGTVDPASLADRLTDLTTLRLAACPDAITPTDRALYTQRMTELNQALTGLLAASTGVPATVPLVLPPVRLEVRSRRLTGGGTEFRIRVYPDSFHIDAHDPRLTDDEAQWAQHLKTAAGPGTLPPAEWAQAAARFGPARAAYLLNPDQKAGTRPGPWDQPATATALPGQWLAIGYGPDGTVLAAALGKPIPVPLQMADLAQSPQVTPDGEPNVDPAVRWMIHFGEAADQGMGLSLTVDGGAAGTPAGTNATGPATLSTLLVVGVRTAEATAMLTSLLTAHHYTSGLELVGYGTPTNNTDAASSGFTRSDPGYARRYALEVLRPAASGDAARLAAALGLDPGVFAAAATAPLTEQPDQQAMTALTWQATWGSFLTGLTGMGPPRAEQLRSWATAWLRPGGPLPALRVGPRPYGLLPVVDLAHWADADDPAAADVHSVVTGLTGAWLAADPAAAGLDFDALLARTPVTAGAWGRFAGIMPGWLQDSYDLGQTHQQIEASIAALPGQLTQIGVASGLNGPLTWPAGFVALPDPVAPAAPWPLVNGDGSPFPFAAGPGVTPASYLNALLGKGGQTPAPAALLDFVARQSWAGTAGPARLGWTFGPRGNLGDHPEPPPPGALDELTASVTYLAGRADTDFGSLFGGALDACAHRLDAWVTALATRRLGQLRAAQPTRVYAGGFGWVENLAARDTLPAVSVAGEPGAVQDLTNAGYQLAPSVQQATTAAVLRSGGYLTHHPVTPGGPVPPPDAPFAIDLSSRRARLATWLLDGVRQGEPLSVLLGYRFERTLQEAGLGALVDVFRQAVPYHPIITADASGTPAPTESASPTDVTDGMALYQVYLRMQAQPGLPPPPRVTSDQWTQAQPALAVLADAIDAAADAVTAQALHEALTGSSYAASATLDSVASGVVPPPQLSFLNTPRGGVAVTHRVLVPVPAGQPYPPHGWPATPRGDAEPALTSWLAGLLGDPVAVTAAVTLTDQAGVALSGGPVTVTLASLGLGPLDVAALATRPAELERLAVHTVLAARAGHGPAASGGTLDPDPAGAARPLSAVLAIAETVSQVIGAGRSGDARDLAPVKTVTDPGADLGDLAARVNGKTGGPLGAAAELKAAGDALAAALPGDPLPGSATAATGIPAGADPATLAAALVKAVLLGIPAAAPAGTGSAALGTLVSQARAARAEIASRLAVVAALEPKAGDSHAAQLTARLDQLATALGAGFRALPLISTTPANLIAQATSLTHAETDDPGQAADAWLVKASHVHPPVADLLSACCAAEALGTGPALALTIAQFPVPQSAQQGKPPPLVAWAALPFAGQPPANGTLSLVMAAAAPPPGAFAALVVTDWTEVIPSQRQIAGLAYHYDAPDAQAPQCVLLAVPARRDTATWNYADLAATVTAARDLAHIRGADYADLPATARLVLPAAYFSDDPVARPGPWAPKLTQLSVPANYLTQAPAVTISKVTPSTLLQGQAGVPLTVTGNNFKPSDPGAHPLTPSSFSVTFADGSADSHVTISPNGTISAGTAALAVTIDPQAALGPRSLAAGSATLTNGLTIAPQPLATGCDTARLAQAMTEVTHVITVTGQAFSGPSITLTSQGQDQGAGLVTCRLTSSTESVLLITATIAASAYSPYQEPPGDQVRGPGTKLVPVHYRPPQHRLFNLTLTVIPAAGASAASFPIVLDAII
jgi:hypothetical protein